jgi:hypothetical protein
LLMRQTSSNSVGQESENNLNRPGLFLELTHDELLVMAGGGSPTPRHGGAGKIGPPAPRAMEDGCSQKQVPLRFPSYAANKKESNDGESGYLSRSAGPNRPRLAVGSNLNDVLACHSGGPAGASGGESAQEPRLRGSWG